MDDDRQGGRHALAYQRLVVATGVEPIRPDICGLDPPGVYVVHTIDGSIRVDQGARRRGVREVAWSPRESQETWKLCDKELPVETAKNSPCRHTDRTKSTDAANRYSQKQSA